MANREGAVWLGALIAGTAKKWNSPQSMLGNSRDTASIAEDARLTLCAPGTTSNYLHQ